MPLPPPQGLAKLEKKAGGPLGGGPELRARFRAVLVACPAVRVDERAREVTLERM